MNEDATPNLLQFTSCLSTELFGERPRKAARSDDTGFRASRVELYAERLSLGLDLWTGKPLKEALEEAARIGSDQTKAKRSGCRRRNNSVAG